ncbi:MAG TPA: hypothetical protein VM531_03080 [Sphingomicrobium sp.]|jgi:hypothetical protein|nr:hypothetical protein [Sphingomicrobium sp.]
MFRTIGVAVAMCGATLATQAMACEPARAQEDRVCRGELAENSAAVVKFQKQIRGDAAIYVQP